MPSTNSTTRSDTDTHATLVDDRLAELLSLIQEVDSVELKATVPDAQRRSIVEALEMDPLDAQLRPADEDPHRARVFTRELAKA